MREVKIGLSGKIRSGKTTIADYATEKYGTVQFEFGKALKDSFHRTYPHIQKHPKPRKGYQHFGQLHRAVYGDDYWVNKCLDEIERIEEAAAGYNTAIPDHEGNTPVVLVPPVQFIPMIIDVRQPNEFEMCTEEGFVTIKVEAPIDLRIQRARDAGDNFTEEDLNFESEAYIDQAEADYVIVNTGSIEDLQAQFDKIMTHLLSENN